MWVKKHQQSNYPYFLFALQVEASQLALSVTFYDRFMTMKLQVTLIHVYAHLVVTAGGGQHPSTPPDCGFLNLRYIQRMYGKTSPAEEPPEEVDTEAGFYVEGQVFGGIVMFERYDQHDRTWMVCNAASQQNKSHCADHSIVVAAKCGDRRRSGCGI